MSYIGNEPIVSATRTITEVTATAGQTVFTANGGYTVGYIDVFLNGAQLQTVDFTATDGSSITLTEAAQVGDVIRLVAWGTFSTSNLVSPNYTGTLTGGTDVVNIGSGQLYKDASGNVGVGTTTPSSFQGGGRLVVQQPVGGTAIIWGDQTNDTGFLDIVSGGNAARIRTNNQLILNTNGAERMRINAAGQITTPFQPAFFANNPSSGTVNTYFAFNSVKVNRGSHYNSSNGRFTAPVSGVYSFIVSALGFGATVSRLTFRVNGSDLYGDASASQCRIDATASGSELPLGSKNVIASLNANDYVQVFYGNDSSSTMENLDWVCFGGQLIG